MESIYNVVRILGSIWLCMLLLFFTLGGSRSTQDDKASLLFLIATQSIALPVIQESSGMGALSLGRFSWAFLL
jgi:hypothetical protein